MPERIRKNGMSYVAVSAARLKALELSIDAVDTWLSEFDHFEVRARQFRKAKMELEKMIAEAKGDADANQ